MPDSPAILTSEPPQVVLTRLHDRAVDAARRHAKAPYGSIASRKLYRSYLDANTAFVEALARALVTAPPQAPTSYPS